MKIENTGAVHFLFVVRMKSDEWHESVLFKLELSADFEMVLNVQIRCRSRTRHSCGTNSTKPIIHGICYTSRTMKRGFQVKWECRILPVK